MTFSQKIKAALTKDERRVFSKLDSPQKIQDFLDTFPINFEMRGETYMSPRRALRAKTMHCFEGALFAAAALAYHGQKPLLLDFRTIPVDEDHVVTLFKHNGRWGAISKTNHAILRYRDPVYRDVHELVMSYFHEYFMLTGKKSLREYSKPFDLSRFPLESWVTSEDDLFRLVQALDDAPHVSILSKKDIASLRKISKTELKAFKTVEWKQPKGFKQPQ